MRRDSATLLAPIPSSKTSLIASRWTSGRSRWCETAVASVVLPTPGIPVTTIRTGSVIERTYSRPREAWGDAIATALADLGVKTPYGSPRRRRWGASFSIPRDEFEQLADALRRARVFYRFNYRDDVVGFPVEDKDPGPAIRPRDARDSPAERLRASTSRSPALGARHCRGRHRRARALPPAPHGPPPPQWRDVQPASTDGRPRGAVMRRARRAPRPLPRVAPPRDRRPRASRRSRRRSCELSSG